MCLLWCSAVFTVDLEVIKGLFQNWRLLVITSLINLWSKGSVYQRLIFVRTYDTFYLLWWARQFKLPLWVFCVVSINATLLGRPVFWFFGIWVVVNPFMGRGRPHTYPPGIVPIFKASYLTWIHIIWWCDRIIVSLELIQITTQSTHFVSCVGSIIIRYRICSWSWVTNRLEYWLYLELIFGITNLESSFVASIQYM